MLNEPIHHLIYKEIKFAENDTANMYIDYIYTETGEVVKSPEPVNVYYRGKKYRFESKEDIQIYKKADNTLTDKEEGIKGKYNDIHKESYLFAIKINEFKKNPDYVYLVEARDKQSAIYWLLYKKYDYPFDLINIFELREDWRYYLDEKGLTLDIFKVKKI